MKVIYKFEEIPSHFGSTVATVGNFDGVHLAHVRVLKELSKRAKILGVRSIALTFEPHPMRMLRPEIPLKLITPLPEKLRLLESTGIDAAVVLPFTQDLSMMTPEEFARGIIRERLHAFEVHEGYNFRFGRNASGDVDVLTELGRNLGFEVKLYPEMRIRKMPVSSTHIRRLLTNGKVERARHLLGRPFTIQSTVQAGRGYGSKFTVPTINLAAYDELIPRHGVYVTKTKVGKEWFNSVTNVGNRPTFGADSFAIESHLLNFHPLDLAEMAEVSVCFLRPLRDEIKFPSVESLRRQIAEDVKRAERYFQLSRTFSEIKDTPAAS